VGQDISRINSFIKLKSLAFVRGPALMKRIVASVFFAMLLVIGCSSPEPKGSMEIEDSPRDVIQRILHESRNATDTLREEQARLQLSGADLSALEAQGPQLTKFYKREGLDMELQVPEYTLPLQDAHISNYEDFNSKLNLGGSNELLKENGFVAIRNPFNPSEEDIIEPYKILTDKDIPIFVTTDSLLHLYHIQFDETLRQIEEREFYEMLWNISTKLFAEIEAVHKQGSGTQKEAARKALAYISVGLELMKPKPEQVCERDCASDEAFTRAERDKFTFTIPGAVRIEVDKELELIAEHGGFSPSPIFIYWEDYSQYIPRGHYTRSEKLRNYFKAMMWYGRMAFLLKGGAPFGPTAPYAIPEDEAKIQTTSAVLMASALDRRKDILENWDRIYSVTSFYVGLSDDLGPYEYINAIQELFGGKLPQEMGQEDLQMLKAGFAALPDPKIYGGTGGCGEHLTPNDLLKPEAVDECIDKSKGFRLMGQRFIPDSYMLQNAVSPSVGGFMGSRPAFTTCLTPSGELRCFPRGLDVMAVLGSEKAAQVTHMLGDDNYEGYGDALASLTAEFSSLGEWEWNRNLYWSWLHALKSILKQYNTGYPTFMQTEAWHSKQLHTALSSWAQLRHDTILYAKQSYTIMSMGASGPEKPQPPDKPVVGYVEPVPEFYNKLIALTSMTKDGLNELGVLDNKGDARLGSLIAIITRLRDISIKELENEELTEDDYEFIKRFGYQLTDVIEDVDEKAKKTTIIADVHTDQNTNLVLEEGTGYVDLIVVAYKVPDGRILLGAGPVLSYYEFKQDMDDRLTDEKWRELLASGSPPEKPEWVTEFMAS
jgi:hypothetical protein